MALLGVFFAMASAIVWGGGDFCGGLASRRHDQFQVLALASLSGLAVLIISALVHGEPFPVGQGMFLSLLAGVAGAIGLAALYRGLAVGYAALVAPTSGVLGAALPVVYGMLTNGAPAPLRVAGFVFALLGIFLVARASAGEAGKVNRGFLLGAVAGLAFGAFFIFIGQAGRSLVFTPLIIARGVEFVVAMLMMTGRKLALPSPRMNPIALPTGILDAGGNVFYVLASHFVRLDVAAVIASFYPATTVVLSSLILKEKVSRWQRVGVVLCLAAIALISL